eukprot:scaffold248419_cov28-Tisochrysis_lutea.AAC.6
MATATAAHGQWPTPNPLMGAAQSDAAIRVAPRSMKVTFTSLRVTGMHAMLTSISRHAYDATSAGVRWPDDA